MLIIGLTGGIASGKSEVASILKKHNFYIVNSDNIAHTILLDKNIKNTLVEKFGGDILTNGEIDRNKLGDFVFSDPEKRREINKIIHPHVITKIAEMIQQAKNEGFNIVIIESALIGEDDETLPPWLNGLILVTSSEEVRIQRLMKNRQLTYDDALKRIKAQKDPESKRKIANWIITNDGDLKDLENQVTSTLVEELKRFKL
ncbi:MAG TPA: dephospho-CoA kinase [Candidatus Hydrogenedens sp.]|nr:dephospho-CoA kinase [Candidatus Hydrogenedens sp.]HOL19006.1 dephospho-CoA kinase [Candidatus Hydrogenedens sp.]HPP57812.1 dephospho-CoA kinase [Candidatus Hydrogenedens sp.]